MDPSKKRYQPVDTKTPLAKQEESILAFWKKECIFETTIGKDIGGEKAQSYATRPLYSFYDGPPFATGLPHYGHLLAGTIKDVIPRYKTMKGYLVPRRFGWDCHGLPVENEIEKSQGLSGASSIEEFGIARFNEECRKIVLRYTEEWKSIVERFGRWVDFTETYKTMDKTFMESVWWVFASLWKKGLVYKGYKVMPFSTKLGTPLSNFEASENYKDVNDPSVVIKVSLEDQPHRSLLVWTTTPWTLVSNLAITAGPDIDYVVLRQKEKPEDEFVIAKERISFVFPEWETTCEIVQEIKGKELAGLRYKPLFPYFASMKQDGAFRVITDSFVQLGDGTGLVHTAPGFGEDDFYACQKASIPVVCPVDHNGLYTSEVIDYAGRYVKDCDKEIIRRLKNEGRVLIHQSLLHRYPFCWRSDTPLIYKAVSTWFVNVEKIKDKLLKANENINWVPGHIKYGRFGKWLENARDWAISRNRYWGTPIPIWEADDGEVLVISSVQELEELTGKEIKDLHRHYIDSIEIEKNGKKFRRISEVFDCWFESGSMPYAQNHFPFEESKDVPQGFPADFIAEGVDQTRGWFYTLTVLSSALYDSEPFKNVIVNGIILAEDGAKMSKRLRNYPDPMDVISRYGADSVRMYMLSSNAVKADDLCFSEAGVELVLRQVILPVWNAYSFYITYADLYGFDHENALQEIDLQSVQSELDRWILSKTASFVASVEDGLERYDLQEATSHFAPFADMLTNWYIRRSRRRFWSDVESKERREAFLVLSTVLKTFAQVAAPFMPFFTELMWTNLKGKNDPKSIHMTKFPSRDLFKRDAFLEKSHAIAQETSQLAHALRKELKLKVRQPLKTVYVITRDLQLQNAIKSVQEIIKDEINVKEVVIQSDEHEFVDIQAKPNFRVLGKKVGKKMKAVQDAIATISFDDLVRFMESGKEAQLHLHVEGETIILTHEDVAIERKVKEGMVAHHENGLTVALDTALTDELLAEGLAREIVNKLNTMRRDIDLAVSDRIHVAMTLSPSSQEWVQKWLSYIQEETLAVNVQFNTALTHGISQEWDINGEKAVISLQKVSS